MTIIMSRVINYFKPHSPSSPLDFTDRIPYRSLQLCTKETLGSGSFGTVYKGFWNGRIVAIKQYKTPQEISSFTIELDKLSRVEHQNIVRLYGASTSPDNTAYLVMEYAEGGSLNRLLHDFPDQQYDLRHACSWAMQTARGVAYLHSIKPKPIMHRDLKPANLLLFSRGKTLKICDFGTACHVKTQMTNMTGSASYMAPEVFATSNYLESGDVFSWSIIFWEILAREHPYPSSFINPYQILWSVKTEGLRPNELEDCPQIIWDLITWAWDADPKKRPTMKQVAEKMELIYKISLSDRPHLEAVDKTLPQQHQQPVHQPLHGQPFPTTSLMDESLNRQKKALQWYLGIIDKRKGELTETPKSTTDDALAEHKKLKVTCELLQKERDRLLQQKHRDPSSAIL